MIIVLDTCLGGMLDKERAWGISFGVMSYPNAPREGHQPGKNSSVKRPIMKG